MHRLWGKKKVEAPAPTLDDASKSLETRGGAVDEKIKKMDDELVRYKQQLAKMRPGPAKNALQKRALVTLKQKKMYEKQRDSLMNQSFNVDQTKFATENVRDTVTMVAAMKAASKELKVAQKDISIDEIEDLHDDMSDMLEQNDEIQEIMGRTYGVPEELDENDLMDELNALEGELDLEAEAESDELPNYLVNAASAAKSNQSSQKVSEPAQKEEVEVDDLGLPAVPLRKLNA